MQRNIFKYKADITRHTYHSIAYLLIYYWFIINTKKNLKNSTEKKFMIFYIRLIKNDVSIINVIRNYRFVHNVMLMSVLMS